MNFIGVVSMHLDERFVGSVVGSIDVTFFLSTSYCSATLLHPQTTQQTAHEIHICSLPEAFEELLPDRHRHTSSLTGRISSLPKASSKVRVSTHCIQNNSMKPKYPPFFVHHSFTCYVLCDGTMVNHNNGKQVDSWQLTVPASTYTLISTSSNLQTRLLLLSNLASRSNIATDSTFYLQAFPPSTTNHNINTKVHNPHPSNKTTRCWKPSHSCWLSSPSSTSSPKPLCPVPNFQSPTSASSSTTLHGPHLRFHRPRPVLSPSHTESATASNGRQRRRSQGATLRPRSTGCHLLVFSVRLCNRS